MEQADKLKAEIAAEEKKAARDEGIDRATDWPISKRKAKRSKRGLKELTKERASIAEQG